MHIVHLREVLHAAGDATQHAHQLKHLELAVVRAQESVQATVLHELRDDHHRIALRHYALQEYYIGMFELAHYRSLRQEIVTGLVCGAWFQGLYGHIYFRPSVGRQFQFPSADIAELSATCGRKKIIQNIIKLLKLSYLIAIRDTI